MLSALRKLTRHSVVRDWFFKGKTYILIVNSSEGDVSFRLENIPLVNYRDFFTNKKHNAKAGNNDLLLEPRGVILLVSQYNPAWNFKAIL